MTEDAAAGADTGADGTSTDPAKADANASLGSGGTDRGKPGSIEAGDGDDKPLGEAGQKALDAFKDRARKAERDLKAREKELKELQERDMSEKDKADKRVKELEGQLGETQRVTQDAFLRSAIADSKHAVASVADAALLLRQAGVEFDDANQPLELDAKLEALLKEKPFLKGESAGKPQGSANGGEGDDTSAGGGSFNEMIRRGVGRA